MSASAAEGQNSGELEQRLKRCEEAIGYRFNDHGLLRLCLTHASVARVRLDSNERLEFLGDAVLGLVVCEALYHRFPELPEGELTAMKSMLVSRQTCARLATRLGLDQAMIVGKGIRRHTGFPASMLAGVFEATIAGVYRLDGGLEEARSVIERCLGREIDQSGDHTSCNFKSALQHLAQKTYGQTPAYRLVDEKGPDHSKCFKIAAVIGPDSYPAAWGASKKEAEQRAAKNALVELESGSETTPAE